MSKGTIRKPNKTELPSDLFERKSMREAMFDVVQTCEVDVDNSEWEKSDQQLEEEISKLESKVNDIEKRLGDNQGNLSDDIKSIRTEIDKLNSRRPIDLIVKLDNLEVKDLGEQHFQFPTLLKILATKLNVYVVGPAGAGKTHAAIQAAKALDVPFHFTGAVASEFKLTGFIDAQGRIVSTEFRKAFENGGLFLFDEIDASYPQAVLAFNAALANNCMDFPDKRVERHEKFYCIAAANTYGQGADRQYIGRNQLDAASLDRFVFLDWKYDENLERALAGNNEWTDFIQKVRKYIESQKIRHVVSPRASIYGAKLLANGLPKNVVEQTILWKGIDEVTKHKILSNLEPKEPILADAKGAFTPKTTVGIIVKEGDLIGDFTDYNGNEYERYYHRERTILSPQNGKILSIHKGGKVGKGDLLAEIQLTT